MCECHNGTWRYINAFALTQAATGFFLVFHKIDEMIIHHIALDSILLYTYMILINEQDLNFFTNFQFIQLSTEDMKLTTLPGRSQGCWSHAYASTLHLGSAAPYILNAWIETWNMKKHIQKGKIYKYICFTQVQVG